MASVCIATRHRIGRNATMAAFGDGAHGTSYFFGGSGNGCQCVGGTSSEPSSPSRAESIDHSFSSASKNPGHTMPSAHAKSSKSYGLQSGGFETGIQSIIRAPFVRHASERGNGALKRAPIKKLN